MPFTAIASNSNTGDETGRTSWSVTLPSITAGALVRVWVKYEGSETTVTLSDGTNAFTAGTQYSHANGDVHGLWFYYLAHPGSGTTVTLTATFAAAKVYQLLHAWSETYTGGDCVFDVEAGASGTSAAPSSGDLAATGSDELVCAGYAPYSEATFSAPLIDGSAADASKINNPAGSFGASWYGTTSAPFTGPASGTLAGSNPWVVAAVAFKIDDGGSDVALELGVGAAAVAGLAPSLEITGDVSLALGVGAASVAGHAAQFDNGDPAPTATGLDFPGVTGNTASDWLMLAWAKGGGGSGLTTTTPPLAIYPATYLMRVFPRNSSQFFYSGLFHSEDWGNNAFEGATYDYYGMHPYHNTDIIGDVDPLWEIAENAGDKVTYQNGDPATIAFGTYPPVGPSADGWYTQVVTARKVGSDYEYTYYPNWPDTSESKTIQVSNTAHGVAPHPILCIGDAPWNRGQEIYKGVIRGLQFYDAFLSEADITAELASPGATRTPWYLKLNPTPDDIADESGNGHDPEWINANRPALWAESAPLALALGVGAASVTGYAPSLEISNNTDLALGVGAVVLAAPAPALGITAHIALGLGVGAAAVAGPASSLVITAHRFLALGVGAASIVGRAPSLAITGDVALTLGVGAVRADGYAPTLVSPLDIALALGVGVLEATGYAPSLEVSADRFLALGLGVAVLEGFATGMVVTGDVVLALGVGALVMAGYAPRLVITGIALRQSETHLAPDAYAQRLAPALHGRRLVPDPTPNE